MAVVRQVVAADGVLGLWRGTVPAAVGPPPRSPARFACDICRPLIFVPAAQRAVVLLARWLQCLFELLLLLLLLLSLRLHRAFAVDY